MESALSHVFLATHITNRAVRHKSIEVIRGRLEDCTKQLGYLL